VHLELSSPILLSYTTIGIAFPAIATCVGVTMKAIFLIIPLRIGIQMQVPKSNFSMTFLSH
jgi:hypothetical protein